MVKAYRNKRIVSWASASLIVLGLGTALLGSVALPRPASALTSSDFQAGNIISDAVFTNYLSMSVQDIQNFLNAKVPVCDTNGTQLTSHPNGSGGYYTRAQWSTMNGQPAPPYTCLKNYAENPSTLQNNFSDPTTPIPGAQSAAQIIWNAAQANRINPEVILVTLQKEQGLVTDDWPWYSEYKAAMGYGCPDTSACDSRYYGFYNQVSNAAWQFRYYLDHPYAFNYWIGNNYIQYNPDASCGGTTVNIQDASTAALYIYTPYQPNPGSLSQMTDSSPGGTATCGAYGNRNFWWYFTKWFGSTQTTIPYAWNYISQGEFVDSDHTTSFSNSTVNITPGSKAYLQVKARNNGNESWDQSTFHLGTSRPNDRSSIFADDSWLSPTRIQMTEATVAPGDIGTFNFSITAPQTPGVYYEYFDPVEDGITWLNDPGMYFGINVVNRRSDVHSVNTQLSPNATLTPTQYLLSRDGSTTLQLTTSGTMELKSNANLTWSNGVKDSNAKLVAMQSDGNLVEYSQSGSVLWSSGTSGNQNAFLAVQQDGNLVIYSATGTPLWSSTTSNVPDYYSIPFYLFTDGSLLPGQSMNTPQGKYHLELQTDGNLVLYSAGTPLWASGTASQQVSNLSMQPDGNLVIYDKSGKVLWSSGTSGRSRAFLALQQDGNLVLYSATGSPLWDTHTAENSR